MRKLMTIAAIAALALGAATFTSCGGSSGGGAVDTAQKFFDAFYCGDVAKAVPMIIESDRPDIDDPDIRKIMEEMNGHYKSKRYTGVADPSMSDLKETEASVFIDVTSKADTDFDDHIWIDLKLVSGKWYVVEFDDMGIL